MAYLSIQAALSETVELCNTCSYFAHITDYCCQVSLCVCQTALDLNSGLGKSGLKLKVSFVAENHNARQEQNDVTRHTRKKHTAQQRSKGDAAGNHGDVKHRGTQLNETRGLNMRRRTIRLKQEVETETFIHCICWKLFHMHDHKRCGKLADMVAGPRTVELYLLCVPGCGQDAWSFCCFLLWPCGRRGHDTAVLFDSNMCTALCDHLSVKDAL